MINEPWEKFCVRCRPSCTCTNDMYATVSCQGNSLYEADYYRYWDSLFTQ